MFWSTTASPLIAFRYIASNVKMKSEGSCRSKPAVATRFWGYLKLGSVMFTPAVPAAPNAGFGAVPHERGRLSTFVLNGAGRVVVFGRLHSRVTSPRPVFAYALPIMMNGGGPVKMPTLPRT